MFVVDDVFGPAHALGGLIGNGAEAEGCGGCWSFLRGLEGEGLGARGWLSGGGGVVVVGHGVDCFLCISV